MLIMLLLIGAAASQIPADEQAKVRCGRELAKIHSLLCYGIDLNPPAEAGGEMSVTKIPPRFTARARRATEERISSMDLIEACCLKSCSISELLNQC